MKNFYSHCKLESTEERNQNPNVSIKSLCDSLNYYYLLKIDKNLSDDGNSGWILLLEVFRHVCFKLPVASAAFETNSIQNSFIRWLSTYDR